MEPRPAARSGLRPRHRWTSRNHGMSVSFYQMPAINGGDGGTPWEDKMRRSHLTRRNVLKTAALGSAAMITAPYVSGVHAAGTLSLGCWDHWVPGANNALTKLCNGWGEKNKVEVKIDYITSQGEKDKLTGAA